MDAMPPSHLVFAQPVSLSAAGHISEYSCGGTTGPGL